MAEPVPRPEVIIRHPSSGPQGEPPASSPVLLGFKPAALAPTHRLSGWTHGPCTLPDTQPRVRITSLLPCNLNFGGSRHFTELGWGTG